MGHLIVGQLSSIVEDEELTMRLQEVQEIEDEAVLDAIVRDLVESIQADDELDVVTLRVEDGVAGSDEPTTIVLTAREEDIVGAPTDLVLAHTALTFADTVADLDDEAVQGGLLTPEEEPSSNDFLPVSVGAIDLADDTVEPLESVIAIETFRDIVEAVPSTEGRIDTLPRIVFDDVPGVSDDVTRRLGTLTYQERLSPALTVLVDGTIVDQIETVSTPEDVAGILNTILEQDQATQTDDATSRIGRVQLVEHLDPFDPTVSITDASGDESIQVRLPVDTVEALAERVTESGLVRPDTDEAGIEDIQPMPIDAAVRDVVSALVDQLLVIGVFQATDVVASLADIALAGSSQQFTDDLTDEPIVPFPLTFGDATYRETGLDPTVPFPSSIGRFLRTEDLGAPAADAILLGNEQLLEDLGAPTTPFALALGVATYQEIGVGLNHALQSLGRVQPDDVPALDDVESHPINLNLAADPVSTPDDRGTQGALPAALGTGTYVEAVPALAEDGPQGVGRPDVIGLYQRIAQPGLLDPAPPTSMGGTISSAQGGDEDVVSTPADSISRVGDFYLGQDRTAGASAASNPATRQGAVDGVTFDSDRGLGTIMVGEFDDQDSVVRPPDEDLDSILYWFMVPQDLTNDAVHLKWELPPPNFATNWHFTDGVTNEGWSVVDGTTDVEFLHNTTNGFRSIGCLEINSAGLSQDQDQLHQRVTGLATGAGRTVTVKLHHIPQDTGLAGHTVTLRVYADDNGSKGAEQASVELMGDDASWTEYTLVGGTSGALGDSSGNGNDLDTHGDPQSTPASDSKYGTDAIDLDGSDGVERQSSDFSLTGEFGYVFVGVIDSTPGSDSSRIMISTDDSGSAARLAALALNTDGTLVFNDNSGSNVTSTLTVPTGETVGIIAKRDGTDNVQVHVWDATNGWREFINDDRGNVTSNGNAFLGIGLDPVNDDFFLDGQVDHAEVYSGASTPALSTLKDRADPSVSGTGGTGDPNGNEVGLYEFEGGILDFNIGDSESALWVEIDAADGSSSGSITRFIDDVRCEVTGLGETVISEQTEATYPTDAQTPFFLEEEDAEFASDGDPLTDWGWNDPSNDNSDWTLEYTSAQAADGSLSVSITRDGGDSAGTVQSTSRDLQTPVSQGVFIARVRSTLPLGGSENTSATFGTSTTGGGVRLDFNDEKIVAEFGDLERVTLQNSVKTDTWYTIALHVDGSILKVEVWEGTDPDTGTFIGSATGTGSGTDPVTDIDIDTVIPSQGGLGESETSFFDIIEYPQPKVVDVSSHNISRDDLNELLAWVEHDDGGDGVNNTLVQSIGLRYGN